MACTTEILELSDDIIPKIGKHLEEGNVALLPSNNTYGFFTNALNENGVKEIYRLKGRGAEKPLGLYIDKERAPRYGDTRRAENILELWPCPITIIVPKLKTVPNYITCGFESVLMVCPDEFCTKLNEYVDFPIACTSANRSGEASISDLEEACENFDGHVPMIVDGGRSKFGANGTIINFESAQPTVMRVGPYPVKELRKLIPDMVIADKMI
jgi:tRNA threonylcarbamoyl adenosine modification protein (Sua5/YciO/YrdC/YwlC family)